MCIRKAFGYVAIKVNKVYCKLNVDGRKKKSRRRQGKRDEGEGPVRVLPAEVSWQLHQK